MEIENGVDVPRAVAIDTHPRGGKWRSSSDVVDPGPQQWPWAFDYQRRPQSRGIGGSSFGVNDREFSGRTKIVSQLLGVFRLAQCAARESNPQPAD